jgi:uncharacterized protein
MKRLSSEMRRLALLIAGWFFVVLGILGLFLPILQGVLFLFVGAGLLSLASPRVRLWRMRLGSRYPMVRRGQEQAQAWMKRMRARFHSRPGGSA